MRSNVRYRSTFFSSSTLTYSNPVQDQKGWGAKRNKWGCTFHGGSVNAPIIIFMNRRIELATWRWVLLWRCSRGFTDGVTMSPHNISLFIFLSAPFTAYQTTCRHAPRWVCSAASVKARGQFSYDQDSAPPKRCIVGGPAAKLAVTATPCAPEGNCTTAEDPMNIFI